MLERFKGNLTGLYCGLFFMLFPLIIRIRQFKTLPVDQKVYGLDQFTEMFHQFKGQVLTAFVGILLVILLISWLVGDLKVRFNRVFLVAVSSYAVMVTLSYLTASDKALAWRGTLDHYEGLPVLLSYAGLCLCFYICAKKFSPDPWLEIFFTINNFFVFIIGIMQTAGFNLLNTDWVIKLAVWPGTAEITSVGNSGMNSAFATLGNQNFMGSYLTLALPILMYSFWRASTKRSLLIRGGMLFLALLTLLCSESLAGTVGFCAVAPFIAYMLHEVDGENRKAYMFSGLAISALVGYELIRGFHFSSEAAAYVAAMVVFVISFAGIGAYGRKQGPVPFLKFMTVIMTAGLILVTLGGVFVLSTAERKPWPVTELKVAETEVRLTIHGDRFIITPSNGSVAIEDAATSVTKKITGKAQAQFVTRSGKEVRITQLPDASNPKIFGLVVEKPYLVFLYGEVGGKMHLSLAGNGGVPIELVQDKGIKLLDGLERLGSGRAYILSRSLKLVPEYWLLGAGPDNFVAVFPQNELLPKMAVDNTYLIIDKPHNWYLQMMINTGLISALAVISLMVVLSKRVSGLFAAESAGHLLPGILWTAIIGYGVANLFNDSVTSVAPIFWAFLGIAYALTDHAALEKQPTAFRRK